MKRTLLTTLLIFNACLSLRAEPVHRLGPPVSGPVTNWWTFGVAVALDGDYALVGAPTEGTGFAYVYYHAATGWVQQARWPTPPEAVGGRYGETVALSGDFAVVGAMSAFEGAGRVYVYQRSGTNWSLHSTLAPEVGTGQEYFGAALAAQGDLLLVAAPAAQSSWTPKGAAYVYRWRDGGWAREARLRVELSADPDITEFGRGVAVYGNWIGVLGAIVLPGEENKRPAVYLFEGLNPNWSLRVRLNPSRPGWGNGTFSTGFALGDATVLLADATGTNNTPVSSGVVYVFERPPGGWGAIPVQTERAILSGPEPAAGDYFGQAVALEADIAVIGAPRHYAQRYWGETYVFTRSASGWTPHSRLRPSDDAIGLTGFGSVYALNKGRILAGAPTAYVSFQETGCAYLFEALSPGPPFSPTPASGQSQVSLGTSLSWSNGNTTATMDLYFNQGLVPTNKVLENVSPVTTFNPGPLQGNRAYAWQVVCRSPFGVTEGPVWRFSTVGPLDFEVAPTNLAFGGVLTNTVSAPRALAIVNPGARPINLALNLNNPAFWMRLASEGAPTGFVSQIEFPLDIGATATVAIAFAPTNPQPHTEILRVRTTDAGWEKLTNTVLLTGEGLRAPPGPPTNPLPPSGATGIETHTLLRWQNGQGTDTIDLRFGLAGDHLQELLSDAPPLTAFELRNLAFATDYAWQIRCRNVAGVTPGPVWTFRTADPPEFRVDYPEGGEIWTVATTHPIRWRSHGASHTVRLELWSLDPAPHYVALIADGVPNEGEYPWLIDPRLDPGRAYCVRVIDGTYTNYYGQSHGTFTLELAIVTLSPNGGERIRAGAPFPITWAGASLGGEVHVDLWHSGVPYRRLGPQPNTGTFLWNVPCDFESRELQIYVTWAENPAMSDGSDAPFEVAILPPDPASNPTPADRAVDVPLLATLMWSNGPGACDVEVWLGTSAPPGELLYAGPLTNQCTLTRPLLPSTAYYWRVVTRNPAGATNSPVWRFVTADTPIPPRLARPKLRGHDLDLEWTPHQSGVLYEVFSTTNLDLPFTPLTLLRTNRFTHTNALSGPGRFYRIMAAPPLP